ncbi:hypothetical protein HKX48_006839 [Thoreauomyces humboldtii]|nr:hypothetical protein HKX48_006839 [Thoreauomyces humboldtii]
MTGSGSFSINVTGVGQIRFSTEGEPARHPFFRACQRAVAPKAAAAHKILPPGLAKQMHLDFQSTASVSAPSLAVVAPKAPSAHKLLTPGVAKQMHSDFQRTESFSAPSPAVVAPKAVSAQKTSTPGVVKQVHLAFKKPASTPAPIRAPAPAPAAVPKTPMPRAAARSLPSPEYGEKDTPRKSNSPDSAVRWPTPVRSSPLGSPVGAKRPRSDAFDEWPEKRGEQRTPGGIYNSGQTCYIGASLQMLYSLPFKFRFQQAAAALEAESLNRESVWKCLAVLFRDKDDQKSVHVGPLRKMMGKLLGQFLEDRQEDAQEFLSALLAQLKNEFRPHLGDGKSPVDLQFKWTAERTLECKACGNTSKGPEPFENLPLDLISSMRRAVHLKLLVENFFKGGTDPIEWKCTRCGASEARKMYEMRSLPPVILVHLKRFWLEPTTFVVRKRTDEVTIPMRLDLGSYRAGAGKAKSSSPQVASMFQKNNGDTYTLRSIVSHLGENSRHGHYVADVYDSKTERWTCFDDNYVTSAEHVSFKRKREAYILAYVRSEPKLS